MAGCTCISQVTLLPLTLTSLDHHHLQVPLSPNAARSQLGTMQDTTTSNRSLPKWLFCQAQMTFVSVSKSLSRSCQHLTRPFCTMSRINTTYPNIQCTERQGTCTTQGCESFLFAAEGGASISPSLIHRVHQTITQHDQMLHTRYINRAREQIQGWVPYFLSLLKRN